MEETGNLRGPRFLKFTCLEMTCKLLIWTTKNTLKTARGVRRDGTTMPLIPAFEAEKGTRAQGSLLSPGQPGLRGETPWTHSGLRKRLFLLQTQGKLQTGSCHSELGAGLLQSAIKNGLANKFP